ncbi:ArsR/SmtB family transcription factor [Pedobacter gandavensis]|uniref:Metalloregulator ArsR/SmtB family transcription factor n=1 Tax=Pedobacter gandavensis TaxID=2679963 RepID=A0ABR6EWY8_9SPHI|nr:metalloregulator ArsR/SmtB family transcription factor [Pedobacter gandavensis]MBB2149324.1 metalloregulator ArsR/SmtB family transcription factor [Pedobacter gandavensis]
MIIRRDVFQAIADPTRRQIIEKISGGPMNLNTIAESFNSSRQAISKHIQILTECGLIVITQKGRERYCEARLEQLNEVSDWVVQSKKQWVHQFEKLDQYLQDLKTKSQNDGNH